MSLASRYHPEAAAELDAEVGWYEDRKTSWIEVSRSVRDAERP